MPHPMHPPLPAMLESGTKETASAQGKTFTVLYSHRNDVEDAGPDVLAGHGANEGVGLTMQFYRKLKGINLVFNEIDGEISPRSRIAVIYSSLDDFEKEQNPAARVLEKLNQQKKDQISGEQDVDTRRSAYEVMEKRVNGALDNARALGHAEQHPHIP